MKYDGKVGLWFFRCVDVRIGRVIIGEVESGVCHILGGEVEVEVGCKGV